MGPLCDQFSTSLVGSLYSAPRHLGQAIQVALASGAPKVLGWADSQALGGGIQVHSPAPLTGATC